MHVFGIANLYLCVEKNFEQWQTTFLNAIYG